MAVEDVRVLTGDTLVTLTAGTWGMSRMRAIGGEEPPLESGKALSARTSCKVAAAVLDVDLLAPSTSATARSWMPSPARPACPSPSWGASPYFRPDTLPKDFSRS